MTDHPALERAFQHASTFLDGLDREPVRAERGLDALRDRFGGPLPETGMPAEQVVDALAADMDGGLLGSAGGRFFGWVIGGTLPSALAADWMVAAWDQNAAGHACGPGVAVLEEISGAWLKDLFGLPTQASFGFVTGCQMAHTTALAAARNRLLAQRSWDVERQGLSGAPALRLLTTAHRHESLIRALRLLGIGENALCLIESDEQGRMRPEALEAALAAAPGVPSVVSLQAGDLNTGTFDDFGTLCDLAHAHKAWVHVDGAFGLWVAVSKRFRHHLAGVERADSWASDGHKWLNVPYDSGFVFVADPDAHQAAMGQTASYKIEVAGARDPHKWNPEWSRRARAVPVYAAIRELGRAGIAGLVEGCCDRARDLVAGLGALPGVEVLAAPQINQGLVRFLAEDGDHDRYTDAVIAAIQQEGTAWFGGTTWRGQRAMRVSVCSWRTGEEEVARTLDAVGRVLSERRAA